MVLLHRKLYFSKDLTFSGGSNFFQGGGGGFLIIISKETHKA